MLKKTFNWASIVMLSFLSACTTTTWMSGHDWQESNGSALQYFDGEGRLAVKIKDKGSYANFDWTNQGQVQSIAVNTPLGNTVGEICQDNIGVIAINANGEKYQASSAEELSMQLVGFPLPLTYIDHWAMGKWVSDLPHRILPDGALEQGGWIIRRQMAADGMAPRELKLSNQNVDIRLLFTSFEPTENRNIQVCEARDD